MFRRFLYLIAGLLLMAGLSACHSVARLTPFNAIPAAPDMAKVLADAKLKLQNTTPCCNSYADFSYQTRVPWQPTRFVLGPNSPVANLNGSRTHFLTFALPSGIKLPYEIGLKSEINGRWVHSSYLFAPSYAVLDAAFQPISGQDIQLCEYMGWSDAVSGAFGRIRIDSDKARYLVLYSSATQLSSNTYWEQSAIDESTAGGSFTGMGDTSGTTQVQHGPDGVIWLGLMSNDYRRALDKALCEKPKPGNGLLNGLGSTLEFWHRDSPPPSSTTSSGSSASSGSTTTASTSH
ncbi:hypothetical protein ACYJW8_14050 [Frateuria aurantia]